MPAMALALPMPAMALALPHAGHGPSTALYGRITVTCSNRY